MGDVESGVLATFAEIGIKEPRTAPEMLAIRLANRIDNISDEKNLAGLSRELRLCLEEVRNQPPPTGDFLIEMTDRQ